MRNHLLTFSNLSGIPPLQQQLSTFFDHSLSRNHKTFVTLHSKYDVASTSSPYFIPRYIQYPGNCRFPLIFFSQGVGGWSKTMPKMSRCDNSLQFFPIFWHRITQVIYPWKHGCFFHRLGSQDSGISGPKRLRWRVKTRSMPPKSMGHLPKLLEKKQLVVVSNLRSVYLQRLSSDGTGWVSSRCHTTSP